MKNPQSMIEKAQMLEQKGLLRRAMSVWQDIAVQTSTQEQTREVAWDRLMRISAMLEHRQQPCYEEKPKRRSENLQTAEDDRLQVIACLKRGMTPSQIVALVPRSISFIYSCKKYV